MSITKTSLVLEIIRKLGANFIPLHGEKPVIDAINEAQLDILNTLPERFLSNAIKTAKADIAANTALYQFPDDLMRLVEVRVDYAAAISETNRGKQALEYIPEEHFGSIDEIATRNYPFFTPDIEKGFEVYPTVSAAVTNGLWIKYIYRLPSVSDNQDCLLDKRLKNLLVYRATSLCCSFEGFDEKLAGKYNQYYNDELKRLLPKLERSATQ